MNFTGTTNTIVRNIYPQTNEAGATISLIVDNPTGLYQFGFSGTSGTLLISFSDGKMIGPNGEYFSSYQAGKNISLELDATATNYNLWKSDIPHCAALPRTNTGGYYDYFIMTRPSINDNIDFDVNIVGDNEPIVLIDNLGYLFTTGQREVTGYFRNSGRYYVNIFDSAAINLQNLTFSGLRGVVQPGAISGFRYIGNYNGFNFTNPIPTTFNTNFNDISVDFYVIDLTTGDRSVFINPTDFAFDLNNQVNRTIGYSCYSGGILSDYPAHLNFALNYVSGSGTFTIDNFATQVSYSTIGYGNIIESGLLTGNFYSVTGDQYVTGLYTISGTQFQWAVGTFSKFFSGTSLGYGTGLGYSGLAISDFTGNISATILDGSGTFLFNSEVTGLPVKGTTTSFFYPNYNNATGYLDISPLLPGDTIYIATSGTPIVNGFQYHNITGLSGYLNSNTNTHKSFVSSGTTTTLYLRSTISGSLGNNIYISPNSCNVGQLSNYSPFLSSGIDIGSTGVGVVAVGIFTGQVVTVITGSGDYSALMTGRKDGIFTYTKTFTGQWDIITGNLTNTGISLKTNPNFNTTGISGSGLFPANSYFTIQIIHRYNPYSQDAAQLIISGDYVVDPQIAILIN